MWMETAREALTQKRCLEIRYNGFARVVEVHACGYTAKGDAVMRVWKVRGGSASGERTGCKLLRLDEARAVGVLGKPVGAPRPGYKRGDPSMSRIVAQV